MKNTEYFFIIFIDKKYLYDHKKKKALIWQAKVETALLFFAGVMVTSLQPFEPAVILNESCVASQPIVIDFCTGEKAMSL